MRSCRHARSTGCVWCLGTQLKEKLDQDIIITMKNCKKLLVQWNLFLTHNIFWMLVYLCVCRVSVDTTSVSGSVTTISGSVFWLDLVDVIDGFTHLWERSSTHLFQWILTGNNTCKRKMYFVFWKCSKTWAYDHLRISTNCLQRPPFWGPIFIF